MSGIANAQSSSATHPTVAPLAPTATMHSTGPFLNPGDSTFNNGEEPRVPTSYVDHGGYIDLTSFSPTLDQNVHRWIPSSASPTTPEGWVTQSVTIPGDGPVLTETASVSRLRGYLRGSALPVGPQGQIVEDAGFELLATPFVVGRPTVLVLSYPSSTQQDPSHGSGEDQGYFGYSGLGSSGGVFGLGPTLSPDVFFAHAGFVVAAQNPNQERSFEFNMLLGKCMPRTEGNNPVFHVQRGVQLIRAMQQIVQSPDPTWRPPGWVQQTSDRVTIAEGGSYGGYVAMWSVLLFPKDFHGAFSGGAPASIRTYIGEQESHRYLQTLLGLGTESGVAHSPLKSFHFGHLAWEFQQFVKANGGGSAWDIWQPFYHTSVTRAWRDGWLKRPVYFFFGDEDAVHSGTATMARFDGIRGYHDHGQILAANGRSYVGWAVADRRCHQAGFHRTARGTSAHHLNVDLMEFIDTVNPLAVPATAPFPPPAPAPANDNEDPFDHVFTAPKFQQPGPQNALFLDTTFGGGSHPANTPAGARRPGKAVGSGLWLGAKDSMVIRNGALYVGSAEGVVTKFVVNTAGASPSLEPEAVGASTALGYGAWALAVGDVASNAGDEIVVGTYRALYVLSATPNNGVLPILAEKTDLPWAHTRPHHLKIANIAIGGQDEFAFASEHGDLVVCGVSGGGISELWRYPEGGILDLECLGLWEFALLTSRGHLVKIQRNVNPTPGMPPVELTACSSRLFGGPVDLERSGDQLIVLQSHVKPAPPSGPAPTGHSLRAFAVADLADIPLMGAALLGMQYVTTEPNFLTPIGAPEAADLEILDANHWVVLNNQAIYGITVSTGTVAFRKNLASYSTTAWPLDVAVGDLQSVLVGSSEWGTDTAEVAVATRSGYVTWLPVSCLFCAPQPSNVMTQVTVIPPGNPHPAVAAQIAMVLDLPHNTYRRPGFVNGAPMLSSRTTSGTWGMTRWFDPVANKHWLELVDQAGSRWRMDPVNGDLTFQHDLRRRWRGTYGVQTYELSVPSVGPLLGIASVGTPGVGPIPPINGDANPWLETVDFTASVPGTMVAREMRTHAFRPQYPAGKYFNYGFGRWMNLDPQRIYVYDGFAVFPHGGSATGAVDQSAPPLTVRQAHWWSGSDDYEAWPNLVEGAYFGISGDVVQDWWASSRRTSASFGLDILPAEIQGNDLRDGFPLGLAQADAQAICTFHDANASLVLVAVGTAGGSAIIMDPQKRNQISPWVRESQDFGSGGMGLAVAKPILVGSVDDINYVADVYLGTLMYHAAGANHQSNAALPDKMFGAVVWLEWTGADLAQHMLKILDGSSSNNPLAYGVCGIATGDVIRTNTTKELVVTTLDGQLLVFERTAQGHVGSLLLAERLEGSVAPFNSLIVGDLDPNAPGEEIYVAGSLGVRKFRS